MGNAYIHIYIFYLIAEAHESFVRGRGGLFLCVEGRGRGQRFEAGLVKNFILKIEGKEKEPLSGRWATAIKSDVLR